MAVAAIAVLSSCTSDNEVAGNLTPKEGQDSFTATIETGSTRTTLGTGDNANKVLWSANAQISINGTAYTLSKGEGTTQATFTGSDGLTSPYQAYYPASLYNSTSKAYELPAEQTYEAGAISNLPMYAESNDHNLVFKNLCGVLAITVPQSEMSTVSSITVYADQQLNGAISVNYNSGNPTVSFSPAQSADDYKKVTLTFASAKTIGSEGETFYIAVPANTYSSLGIVVEGEKTVTNGTVAAKLMKSTGSSMPVQRNHIYSINFNSTYAIRGTATVSSTAGRTGNKCGWVQLWEDGPKFAEFNVGATIDSYGSLTSGTESTSGSVAYYNTANCGGLYPWKNPSKNGRTTTWTSTVTTGTSDVATTKWGNNWKTPTKTQLTKLLDGVTGTDGTGTTLGLVWEWIDGSTSHYVSGCTLAGYKISGAAGTAYASNSIFLPKAGYYSYGYSSIQEGVAYWSATTSSTSGEAYGMNGGEKLVDSFLAGNGRSVRAILNE